MMKITKSISQGIKKFIIRNADGIEESSNLALDVREEYANAFRTESYNEFWENVLEFSKGNCSTNQTSIGSTTAARLPSYRFFVDNLLDPDQHTVFQALALNPTHTKTHSNLLSDYFSETSNAFRVFGHLLKNIDHMRIKYKSLKNILESIRISRLSSSTELGATRARLVEIFTSFNPTVPSTSFPNPSGIKMVQTKCSALLRQLESSRDETQSKVRLVSKLKKGSTVFLVAITASLTILVAPHALALLAAAPGFVVASFKVVSAKKLDRWVVQLDTAAKGSYILIRDMETVTRFVARLNDDLEHVQGVMQLLVEKGEEWHQAGEEIVRQLKLSHMSFCEQLDELEEHLYLCLMTINRARNLVFKEITDKCSPH